MNASDTPAELHVVFQIQRAAYDAAPFAEWEERRNRLERLRRLLEDNEAAIETAIDVDFAGRPRIETQIGRNLSKPLRDSRRDQARQAVDETA